MLIASRLYYLFHHNLTLTVDVQIFKNTEESEIPLHVNHFVLHEFGETQI